MPTMHRLSCFRDDIIFIIYLYQRWVYRVDKNRDPYGSLKKEEKEEEQKEIQEETDKDSEPDDSHDSDKGVVKKEEEDQKEAVKKRQVIK